ncbi:MAG: PqqD family peptide modification chaperone [Myxococcales bacterium]|nr:PqqD family peptide modification chaperone [Myxococcales bacterium]
MSALPPQVAIPDDVVSEVFDGQAVILNLRTGTYFSLNATGARFWELLANDGDVARAREVMLQEYAVSADKLDSDLSALVSQLVERTLLIARAAP